MELTLREKAIFLIENDFLTKSNAVVILEGDGENRIDFGCRLFNSGFASNIVFSGGALNLEYGSYPYNLVKDNFLKNNVNENTLIIDNKSLHTRAQAEEVISLCLKHNWQSIILVASPYHQLRAFLTFLKVLLEQDLAQKIKIINAPVKELKWFEHNEWGRRIDLLDQEFERINIYLKKGHIASFEQAIEYQRWKESQL